MSILMNFGNALFIFNKLQSNKTKMENVCPVDQQINNDDKPIWSFIGERKISEQEQR